MTYQETVLTAAQGIDTEDFLHHIAWADVIVPRLQASKTILTQQLVGLVLNDTPGAESREKIAGKIFGIDYVIKEIESIVRKGRDANAVLASHDIHLQ